jgi:hypothetical protein
MILAWLLLVTGLTISAVAIYYSVIGLAAIFAAAAIPIYIMGGSLEVAKLVCAAWLKANWSRTPVLMKVYMTTAVLVLMFITSMGIFGFLSQAHSDQTLVSGDVQGKIALYDEQIKTERENIDAARTALAQMDAQVNERLARSADDRGAERAVQIRRQQRTERANLQKEIVTAQATISRLNQERAPIAAEIRKVEAEVGPIKYIAAFVYGENPDANLLEKAVTWVIILIVAVFDPLAVIMLLAAQMTFQWIREKKKAEGDSLSTESKNNIVEPTTVAAQLDLAEEANALIAEIEREPVEFIPPEKPKQPDFDSSKHPYLYTGFSSFKDLKPMVHKPEDPVKEPNISVDAVVEFVPAPVQETDTERPSDYLILPELSEESKKKVYDQAQGSADSQDQAVTYVQNQEQTRGSLWFKIRTKNNDSFKPLDRLHIEFDKDGFDSIIVDANEEPELYQFLEDIKTGTHKYGDYPEEQINYFASRIYELRKN